MKVPSPLIGFGATFRPAVDLSLNRIFGDPSLTQLDAHPTKHNKGTEGIYRKQPQGHHQNQRNWWLTKGIIRI